MSAFDDFTPTASLAGGRMLAARLGGIGLVTFNQPEKRNAMSVEMWQGMADILAAMEADPAIRVVILRGAGDKAFVSGADISQFAGQRADAAMQKAYAAQTSAGREALAGFGKPTIACVRGFCIGGGLAIAMSADLRIASSDSQFGIPAARLGIAYGFEGLRTLVSLVGPAQARMILFTGNRLDAARAAQIGLINEVVAPAALEDSVMAIATRIAENAPLAIAAARAGIAQVLRDESARDLASLRALAEACIGSADYTEGRTAFMEKRRPRFQGR